MEYGHNRITFASSNLNKVKMSRKLDYLVKKMTDKPYIIEMGKNKLARWFKCSPEEIVIAKKMAREVMVTELQETIKLPNILLLDIETAPIKAFVWRLWKENVSLDQISSDWFMLTWSAKWLYSAEVMSDRLTSEEAIDEDDSRIINSLWNLLNKADVIITHNGIAFDLPKANARFVKWGLPPTRPYQQIDTKVIASKQFGFSSNKLEALARMFGIEGKKDTDFKLWVGCIEGDEASLSYMEEYNRHDVVVLEEVYLRLRPWIKGHINLGLYSDGTKSICPNCGSTHLEEDGGYFYTPVGRYKTLRCECGAISRARTSDLTKEVKSKIVVSITR